ncbi:MAG TPA: menaquinone biosynthesis protein, partial [Leptospiraceae bacterium]|nr:menaquinone biosynthesis protein [Leptospiraceae bacterium]
MDLAISPCPNDTFIFCHLMRAMPELQLVFADVEELNQRALFEKKHDLSKLSFYAILRTKGYTLLDCGGAMGQGCGPILLYGKKSNGKISDLKRILTPGKYTTAALLLDLFLAENHPDPAS